jgi:hypothetical protein
MSLVVFRCVVNLRIANRIKVYEIIKLFPNIEPIILIDEIVFMCSPGE